jgi:hypothetical protein
MFRIIGLTLAATTALSAAAFAAPPERIRGTVTAVAPDSVSLHTTDGKDVSVALRSNTRYGKVVKASLTDVAPGSYIGTATKEVGGKLIALEVLIFPPAMKGAGEGHYGWDRIADTTLAGGASASSTMTNGSVSSVTSTGTASTMMTNGTVSAADAKGAARQLTVTYKGGQQTILVPPTAPVVTPQPDTVADLVKGKIVFIIATNDDGKYSANSVTIGTDGVPPPM